MSVLELNCGDVNKSAEDYDPDDEKQTQLSRKDCLNSCEIPFGLSGIWLNNLPSTEKLFNQIIFKLH